MMNQTSTHTENTQNSKVATNYKNAAIFGWGITILLLGGILWVLNEKNRLADSIEITTSKYELMKSEQVRMEGQMGKNNELLNILRAKDIQIITLIGNQAVAPQSFSKVYFNQKDGMAYVDIKTLPHPPIDKEYQLWSLRMEPFSATKIGLLNEANHLGNYIYQFENFPKPESLSITLEPLGGSETPTMSQIYVLDMGSNKT